MESDAIAELSTLRCHLSTGGQCTLLSCPCCPHERTEELSVVFLARAWAARALPACPVPACPPGGSSADWDSCGLSHHAAVVGGQRNHWVLCHPRRMQAGLGLPGPESSRGPMADPA